MSTNFKMSRAVNKQSVTKQFVFVPAAVKPEQTTQKDKRYIVISCGDAGCKALFLNLADGQMSLKDTYAFQEHERRCTPEGAALVCGPNNDAYKMVYVSQWRYDEILKYCECLGKTLTNVEKSTYANEICRKLFAKWSPEHEDVNSIEDGILPHGANLRSGFHILLN